MTYQSAAVTGATGHVGNTLVRALLERECRVTALVHSPSEEHALEGLDVRRVPGDILQPDTLRPAFEGAEVVFHCAATISITHRPDPMLYRVNVEGTANVVQAAHLSGVRRLVHFSSIHALSSYPREETIDETRPLCDETSRYRPHYDTSKAKAERIALDAMNVGVETIILNPTSVIGPGDYLMSEMGKVFVDLQHERLPALIAGSFNWVDVRDVVAGTLAAAERGRNGERYLLTGTRMRIQDLARLAAETAGVAPPKVTLPASLAYLSLPLFQLAARVSGRPSQVTRPSIHSLQNHRDISRAKAEAELDYQARPLEETLRDLYAWHRAQGNLA